MIVFELFHLIRINADSFEMFQADMHHCAAKCCENNNLSIERVHQCVENCSVSLNNAQKYIQGEFEHLQVS